MTREEAIKKHRELWHWIAEEHRKRKSVWVYKNENPEIAEKKPLNMCWLCEYTKQFDKVFPKQECDFCPIKWGENSNSCVNVESPFLAWINPCRFNYEDMARLADTIAELPEKEDA